MSITTAPRYIAMWSGPRNISTAMMRAWGSRADTIVVDEPFYAHYLKHSPYREQHPGADEITAAYETDWRRVAAALTGPVPGGRAIFFQKHMTHHMLPHIDLGWTDRVANCFLIREPGEVLASFAKVIPNPALEQTGLPQQMALFERARRATGQTPPVIDAADVLKDPRGTLSMLCESVGVPFDPAMLSWPAGRRDTDGIWAKYWYDAVEKSTGFAPYQPRDVTVPDDMLGLYDQCRTIYETLYEFRLR